MIRAVLEIVVTILVVALARSIFTSLVKGVSSAAKNAGSDPGAPGAKTAGSGRSAPVSGTLHKDPVCGTFVAETTGFTRKVGSEFFYYCSESCKTAHQLASK